MRTPLALALAALLAACSSSEDRAAKERLFSSGPAETARAAPGAAGPDGLLAVGADEAAARLGSFEWSAVATWSVSRPKAGVRLHLAERHRVRQSAGGDFEVESDLDPGEGAGAETGKRIVYANGMTYARSRYAPFGAWRERPTDRGRDARRFRDESFGLLADAAALYGAALEVTPVGDTTFLGRPVRRFQIALKAGAATDGGPSRLGAQAPDGGPDDDTRRRLAFLDGRIPARADGEILADAASGVPLKFLLKGAFKVKDDPDARVDLELAGQMKALGPAAAAVAPPKDVLPDDRKPRGVARALEAAGLRKRGEAAGEPEEGADEGD
jgi:hypothetical protein